MRSEHFDQTVLKRDTKVEVVIQTLNEQETIGDLLENLRSLVLPVNFSIMVIDGGFRVMEVLIHYGLRKGSDTNLDPLGNGLKIGRTILFILMYVNPLKIFGIMAIGFFIGGLFSVFQVDSVPNFQMSSDNRYEYKL